VARRLLLAEGRATLYLETMMPDYSDRCRELRHKDGGDWDGDADYGGDVEDEEDETPLHHTARHPTAQHVTAPHNTTIIQES
jgi:hypothetical protein